MAGTVVDYDPFAQKPAPPGGTVVDHDPFAAPEAEKPKTLGVLGHVGGALDNILPFVSSLYAQPLATGAEYVARAEQLLGLKPSGTPEQVRQGVADALQIKPFSEAGRIVQQEAGYLPKKGLEAAQAGLQKADIALGTGDAEGGALQAAGGALGKATGDALTLAPLAAGVKGGLAGIDASKQAAQLAAQNDAKAVRPSTVDAARSAGYKTGAWDAQKAELGLTPPLSARATEAVAGRPAMRKDLALENQRNTQGLAGKGLGMEPGTMEFTRESFEQNRAPANAVYDEVSKLPDNPHGRAYSDTVGKISTEGTTEATARDIGKLKSEYGTAGSTANLVERMKTQRRDASKRLMSDSVEDNRLGQANLDIAKAIEQELERRAELAGKPELVQQMRGAREHLAKSFTVEEATRNGHVDALKLAKLSRQQPGLLSDELKIIADAADKLPDVMAHPDVFKTGGDALGQHSVLTRAWEKSVGKLAEKAGKSDYVQNKFGREAADKGPTGPLAPYFKDRGKAQAAVIREPEVNLAELRGGPANRSTPGPAGPANIMGTPGVETPDLSLYPRAVGSGPTGTKAGPASLMGTPAPPQAPNLAMVPSGPGTRGSQPPQAPSGLMPVEVLRDSMGMPIETIEQARSRMLAELLKGKR